MSGMLRECGQYVLSVPSCGRETVRSYVLSVPICCRETIRDCVLDAVQNPAALRGPQRANVEVQKLVAFEENPDTNRPRTARGN